MANLGGDGESPDKGNGKGKGKGKDRFLDRRGESKRWRCVHCGMCLRHEDDWSCPEGCGRGYGVGTKFADALAAGLSGTHLRPQYRWLPYDLYIVYDTIGAM